MSVVLIEYSFHSPSGFGLCRTAMSKALLVPRPPLFMNRTVANQVWVAGSNQQRGSLVYALPPTLNRSFMWNGPITVVPVVL